MQFSIDEEIGHLTESLHIYLTNKQLSEFIAHNNLLQAWGRKMNLTSIQDPKEIARRHFLEGIVAGEKLRELAAVGPLLDLGSGNGFPAVPMAVVCPDARPIILVESSEKKAAFLRALIRDLGWMDARVEIRRAERCSDLADLQCRVFTTRGVAISEFLREGRPFLESGGWCVLFGLRAELEKDYGYIPSLFVLEDEIELPDRDTKILCLRKS
jgi:16S rRNA (guanine527-N7)-methyltransferase